MHLILIATLAAYPYALAERLAMNSQVDALVGEHDGKPIKDAAMQVTRRGLRGGVDMDHPKMKKTSGLSRFSTVECFEQDNGLLACLAEDFPGEGLATVFLDCPTDVAECQSCSIVVTADSTPNEIDLQNDPQCQSCSICSDTIAFDCSNIAEGSCVMQDCDGTCTPSDGAGDDEQCKDVPGWYDSDGPLFDCNFYAGDGNCQLYGSDYESFGYTANEACCVCGGGSIDGEGVGGGGGNRTAVRALLNIYYTIRGWRG